MGSYLAKKIEWTVADFDNDESTIPQNDTLVFGNFKNNRGSGVIPVFVEGKDVTLSDPVFGEFKMEKGYKYKPVINNTNTLFEVNQYVILDVKDIDDDDYNDFLDREQLLISGKRIIENVITLEGGAILYLINGRWISEHLLKLLVN